MASLSAGRLLSCLVSIDIAKGTANPARVLIVDDDEEAASILAKGLRRLGHTVVTTNDPVAAIVFASATFPDFAIIDIALPSIDGCELARELRLRESLNELRLIAMSGHESEAERHRSIAAGF